MGGFLGQQGLAVLLGDLVVVGVDFAEGEETVTVAPEIDESRLQRGFDPRYLGQILPRSACDRQNQSRIPQYGCP
jgi:hypothetical protein